MPWTCCALGCNERYSRLSATTFHSFPADEQRRLLWAKTVRRRDKNGRLWEPSYHSKLCSKHFTASDWEVTSVAGHRRLKGIAVPSVFDCGSVVKASKFGRNKKVSQDAPLFTKGHVMEGMSAAAQCREEHSYAIEEQHLCSKRTNKGRSFSNAASRTLRSNGKISRMAAASLLLKLREQSPASETCAVSSGSEGTSSPLGNEGDTVHIQDSQANLTGIS